MSDLTFIQDSIKKFCFLNHNEADQFLCKNADVILEDHKGRYWSALNSMAHLVSTSSLKYELVPSSYYACKETGAMFKLAPGHSDDAKKRFCEFKGLEFYPDNDSLMDPEFRTSKLMVEENEAIKKIVQNTVYNPSFFTPKEQEEFELFRAQILKVPTILPENLTKASEVIASKEVDFVEKAFIESYARFLKPITPEVIQNNPLVFGKKYALYGNREVNPRLAKFYLTFAVNDSNGIQDGKFVTLLFARGSSLTETLLSGSILTLFEDNGTITPSDYTSVNNLIQAFVDILNMEGEKKLIFPITEYSGTSYLLPFKPTVSGVAATEIPDGRLHMGFVNSNKLVNEVKAIVKNHVLTLVQETLST